MNANKQIKQIVDQLRKSPVLAQERASKIIGEKKDQYPFRVGWLENLVYNAADKLEEIIKDDK